MLFLIFFGKPSPRADWLGEFSYQVGKAGPLSARTEHNSYWTPKLHMAGSGVISALVISVSAYLTSSSPLCAAGAIATYTSAAFTVTLVFSLPVNNDLCAMRKSTMCQGHLLLELGWHPMERSQNDSDVILGASIGSG
jgi:hypothetical protein